MSSNYGIVGCGDNAGNKCQQGVSGRLEHGRMAAGYVVLLMLGVLVWRRTGHDYLGRAIVE